MGQWKKLLWTGQVSCIVASFSRSRIEHGQANGSSGKQGIYWYTTIHMTIKRRAITYIHNYQMQRNVLLFLLDSNQIDKVFPCMILFLIYSPMDMKKEEDIESVLLSDDKSK